jgi:hypothetical protein
MQMDSSHVNVATKALTDGKSLPEVVMLLLALCPKEDVKKYILNILESAIHTTFHHYSTNDMKIIGEFIDVLSKSNLQLRTIDSVQAVKTLPTESCLPLMSLFKFK